jgi:ADP-ribose pyrophosphatase YjhB (NUDIX family)
MRRRCNVAAKRDELACARCRYLIFDYPRLCAGAIVVKRDQVLVLRRGHEPRRGMLDVPGGFVEAGEALEASARRELREETGLTVGKMHVLGNYWDRYFIRGYGHFPTFNAYWIARWRRGEPVAGDDAATAEWVPLASLGRRGHAFAWKHMTELFADVRRWVHTRRRP